MQTTMAICATFNMQKCDELLSLLPICLTAAQQQSTLILALWPLSFLISTIKAIHGTETLDPKNPSSQYTFLTRHKPQIQYTVFCLWYRKSCSILF